MTAARRQFGFSLTEVLLAVMTLAIGMLFVGGTFVLGVHFSTLSTEQSIGAIVAEEAFAKLRLYGVNTIETNTIHAPLYLLDASNIEYTYPSTDEVLTRQYQWSAVGRGVEGTSLVQVTVFVVRTQFASLREPRPVTASWNPDITGGRWVVDDPNVMNGMNLVHDPTGLIRRVSWPASDPSGTIEPLQPVTSEFDEAESTWWMIDPVDGRNPVVGLYQKVMRLALEPDSETSGGQ